MEPILGFDGDHAKSVDWTKEPTPSERAKRRSEVDLAEPWLSLYTQFHFILELRQHNWKDIVEREYRSTIFSNQSQSREVSQTPRIMSTVSGKLTSVEPALSRQVAVNVVARK